MHESLADNVLTKCKLMARVYLSTVSQGGKMVNTARVATMVVGELCHVGDSNSPHSVTELWILDSVQHHILLPFLDYPLP